MQRFSNCLCRSMRPLLLVCGAVVIAFAMGGCSKSPAKTESIKSPADDGPEVPTKAAGPPKPCEIVSKEELKTITGVEFDKAVPLASVVCTFSTADGKQNLILTITRGSGKSRIDANKKFKGFQMLDGFGDEAIWVATPGYFEARKGDDSVGITITGEFGDDATRLKHAKAIVKLMLERM